LRLCVCAGNEVLELLRKNPAVAIPTVLARLKQKDEEWRRARLELNKGWKEVRLMY
jgi:paired amphipathic helix protein Sin3a